MVVTDINRFRIASMPPMTPHEIAIVRRQFGGLAARRDVFAAAFYDNLFEADPTLRPLFPADMRPQRAKLVAALAHVILALDDLAAVREDLAALGLRHAGYGVEAEHYDTVGAVLIATLAELLGPAFDETARGAWARAYATVAEAMMAAGAEARRLHAA